MRIGKVEIHLLCDGSGRADGGGFFGLVPKVMWALKHPADDQNRVLWRVNSLLIKDGEHNIVVDTGFGSKLQQRTRNVMGVTEAGQLPLQLQQHGLSPSQVDIVINTHLHFDHAGGNTVQDGTQIVPAFANATYIAQKGEWEDANHPNERTRASYLAENLLPVAESGRLRLIEGDTQITPHVRCIVTPGHTPHHQSVLVESEGEKALYLADLSPFAVHLERLAWVAAYDLEPMRSIETKRQIQRWAIETGALLIFPHDPEIGTGRLVVDSGRLRVQPIERVEANQTSS